MAYAPLTVTQPINTSCPVGKIAYTVFTTDRDGFKVGLLDNGVSREIVLIGDIREINNPASDGTYTMKVETTLGYSELGGASGLSDRFIMFTKDNKAHLRSPLGYFASAKSVNTSVSEAEMFSVAMEVFDSSK